MRDKGAKVGTRRRCRPLRVERAGELYFVTSRVTESRFWLHPILSCCLTPLNHKARRVCKAFERKADHEVRKLVAEANRRMGPFQAKVTVPVAKVLLRDLVGACLARAQRHCRDQGSGEVELFGFVAMSNHVHLVVRTGGKNLAQFMRYFGSAVASGINYLTGRRGQLFGRRYDAQPILDDDAAAARLRDSVDNPRAAGLVSSHDEWPGQLLCFGFGASDVPVFKFFNRMAWHEAKRPKDITPFIDDVTLTLSPLPHLSALDRDGYRRTVEGWLRDLQSEAGQHRGHDKRNRDAGSRGAKFQQRPVLGAGRIISAPIGHRPERAKHKRRPYAFGAPDKLRAHREAMGIVIALHQDAAERLRVGDRNVSFPEGTYAPPITIAA